MSEKLFILRSKVVPDLYVVERAGAWARWDEKAQALQGTKEWWLKELNPNWESFFVLEEMD